MYTTLKTIPDTPYYKGGQKMNELGIAKSTCNSTMSVQSKGQRRQLGNNNWQWWWPCEPFISVSLFHEIRLYSTNMSTPADSNEVDWPNYFVSSVRELHPDGVIRRKVLRVLKYDDLTVGERCQILHAKPQKQKDKIKVSLTFWLNMYGLFRAKVSNIQWESFDTQNCAVICEWLLFFFNMVGFLN